MALSSDVHVHNLAARKLPKLASINDPVGWLEKVELVSRRDGASDSVNQKLCIVSLTELTAVERRDAERKCKGGKQAKKSVLDSCAVELSTLM
jgi:hypothetical protein